MKTKTTIIRLTIATLSILVIIFSILYLISEVIRIDHVTILDWVPIFTCLTAYLTAGLITNKIPAKFIPILFIPLYFFVLMGFGDLFVILILFAIGTLLITRKKIKNLHRIFILTPMLIWFLFCLFSEPLVINKYDLIEVNGQKIEAHTGQIVIWNFHDNNQQKLPDLNLLDEMNTKISLTQYKGKKIFITFWATWCGPCVADKPQLEVIKSTLKEHPEIIFIDISLDEDFERWKAYIDNKKPQGIQLVINENPRTIYKKFKCTGIPFGVIVDFNGNFVASNQFRPQGINIIETMKELKSAHNILYK